MALSLCQEERNNVLVDVVYSEEVNKYVDAYQARELYLQGEITDQKKFKCMVANCQVRYTCKGLYHNEKELKKRIHFMRVGMHNHGNISAEIKGGAHSDEEANPNHFIDETTDILLPSPKNKEKAPEKTRQDNELGGDTIIRKTSNHTHNTRRKSEYGMIRSIVAKYLGYKNSGMEMKRYIEFKEKSWKYGHFFESIDRWSDNKWNNDNLYKGVKVYYGKARIKKVEEKSDYIVIFSGEVKCKDNVPRLTCYLSKECIDKRYGTGSIVEAFEAFAVSKEEFEVYICGWIKEKKVEDNIYMNLNILDNNLNYFHWQQD